MGLTKSPRGYFKIIKGIQDEWKTIDRRILMRSINNLYESNLVGQKDNKDGTVTLILSKKGHKIALAYNLEEMTILKTKWDKKWRVVMFDIPEKLKKVRESLRHHLKRLGFLELQRSAFIIPFECKSEIEYVVEFYNIKKFVRFLEVHAIDNELEFKRKFHIT